VVPPEPPPSLLERAAQRLLELSSDALGEPQKWWMDCRPTKWGEHTDWEICGRGKPLFVATDHATVSDMEWVTVVSPSVAVLLVAWLRQASLAYRLDGDNTQEENALKFAQAILGESVPGEGNP
jgi:hypothetical protein